MVRLLTALVLLLDAAIAGLLVFQGLGWLDVHPLRIQATLLVAAAALGFVLLAGGLFEDLLEPARRPVGTAFALTGLWILLAPALGSHGVAAIQETVIPGLVENPLLVLALAAVVLGRLALRAGEPHLGQGLALLAPLLLLTDARLLDGPLYPRPFYLGLIGSGLALLLLLTLRERRAAVGWGWSVFLALCALYGWLR